MVELFANLILVTLGAANAVTGYLISRKVGQPRKGGKTPWTKRDALLSYATAAMVFGVATYGFIWGK